MSTNTVNIDNLLMSKMVLDESANTLTHAIEQPSEDLILERNNELRKNPGALRDLGAKTEGGSWGRQVASIPIVIFYQAIKDGYQLNAPDSNFAGREMHRFLLSDIGKTCLVR